jgi:parvulin-like peptidyl-prolyl isomerase
MGFMQKLRQNMPAVIIFLALVFVALIVFGWGDVSRGRGTIHPGGRAIGKVNGEELGLAEFDARVEDAVAQQRRSDPNADVDDQKIRDGVWDQLINETLIRQAGDKLGLSVSDDQLREVLLYDPPAPLKQPFTDSTGYFNQQAYQAFMRDIDGFLTKQGYPPAKALEIKNEFLKAQEQIRFDLLRQAVESAVTSAAIPSIADVRGAYNDQKSKASGTYSLLPVSLIPDDNVKVSDDEARKYFDAHKADFFQKASREIRYVVFQLQPSGQDSNSIKRRLTTVQDALNHETDPAKKDSLFAGFVDQFGSGKYNGSTYTPLQELTPEMQSTLQTAKKGDILGPVRLQDGTFLIDLVDVKDSGEVYVKAQHILLKTGPGINEDSVKAQAEKIYQRAKSGESFEQLATQYSADQGSASRGGDVGYFKKGMMVKPFEDAAFSAAPGSIVGPTKTDYGYHIIKVTDRTTKSFKLRDLKFDVRVSNTTKNLLRRRAQDLRTKLAAGGESIDSLAARQKLQVFESGPISRSEPVAGSAKLTTFAYNGGQGEVSEVIDLPDGSLVVGQISKIRSAGSMEFADAKERIVEKLRLQKKLDLLKDRITKLRGSLAPNDSLGKLRSLDSAIQVSSFTEVSKTSPLPGVGFDYALNAAIFNNPLGQNSQPIRGERGYYLIRVDKRIQPTDQEFNAERTQFTQQLISQRRSTLFNDWLQKAREKAEIEDFRTGGF